MLVLLLAMAAGLPSCGAQAEAPDLFSISPWFGPLSATPALLLNGSGFVDGPELVCAFNTSELNATVTATFVSTELINCTLPSFPAVGEVLVSASNDGFNWTLQVVLYQLIDDYSISSLSPTSALFDTAPLLLVIGSGFVSEVDGQLINTTVTCSLSGLVLPAAVTGPTQIDCQLPVLGVGNYTVEVSLNAVDYTNSSLVFTVLPRLNAPSLVSIWPSFGPLWATPMLRLNGSGFVNASGLLCGFNTSELNVSVDATFVSESVITCQLPSFPVVGEVLVSASSDGFNWTLEAVPYQLIADYSISSLSPASALFDSAPLLLITGSGFVSDVDGQPINASITCSLSGLELAAVFISPALLGCQLPVLGVGNYTVEVSLNALDYTNSSLVFTATAQPTVLSIQPALAISGVTTLTVDGSRLSAPTSSLLCSFANDSGVTQTAAIPVSDARLLCLTPPQLASGQYVLEVSVDAGLSFSSSLLSVTVLPVPVLSSFSPLLTPVNTSAVLTLLGSGFFVSPLLSVRVGAADCPLLTREETELSCNVSASSQAAAVNVSLSVNGVDWLSSSVAFSYTAPPVLFSLSPQLGQTAGGTLVTIIGAALNVSSPVTVRVGGQQVFALTDSGTEAVFLTPTQTAGDVAVSLSYNDDGGAATRGLYSNALLFSYYDIELLTLQPLLGPVAGGTNLTLTGSRFLPGWPLACLFNNQTAVSAVLLSPTAVSCISPAAASAGTVSVAVSANGQDWSDDSLSFLYFAAITVLGLSPAFGPADANTTLLVTGLGFTDWPPLLCTVDQSTAPAVFLSNSSVLCLAAPHAAGHVNVSLSVEGVQAATTLNFTYVPPASVASVFPAVSSMYGESVLTVTGSGFLPTAALSCVIDSSFIAAVFISSYQLSCITLPVSAAGNYSVDVSLNGQSSSSSGVTVDMQAADPSGSYSSYAAQWLFSSAPQLQAALPASGPSAGGTAALLFGVGFVNGQTSCQFGEYALVPGQWLGGGSLLCTCPPNTAGLTSVPLRLTNDNLTFSTFALSFLYYGDPQLHAVALPSLVASVSESGNTQPVVLAGSRFPRLPSLLCFFDSLSVQAVWLSPGPDTVSAARDATRHGLPDSQRQRLQPAVHSALPALPRAALSAGATAGLWPHARRQPGQHLWRRPAAAVESLSHLPVELHAAYRGRGPGRTAARNASRPQPQRQAGWLARSHSRCRLSRTPSSRPPRASSSTPSRPLSTSARSRCLWACRPRWSCSASTSSPRLR